MPSRTLLLIMAAIIVCCLKIIQVKEISEVMENLQ